MEWETFKVFYEKRIHFIQLHYIFILGLSMIGSLSLYFTASSTPISYLDALFMATSSVTNTGLNTVAVSSLSSAQLLMIATLSILGSPMMISVICVNVRKHYFSKRFEDILQFNKEQRIREENQRRFEKDMQDRDRSKTSHSKRLSFLSMQSLRENLSTSFLPTKSRLSYSDEPVHGSSSKIPFEPICRQSCSESDVRSKLANHSISQETITVTDSFSTIEKASQVHLSNQTNVAFACDIEQQREIARQKFERDKRHEDTMPGSSNVTFNAYKESNLRQPIDKNKLTRQERYRLGGAEYRALDFLSCLVPAYYFGFIIIFGFAIRSYVALSPYAQSILTVDPWWFSFFTSLSSFNNLGLSQLDEGMKPFQQAPIMLILVMVLVLAGNTAFAILLRLIVRTIHRFTPCSYAMRNETLEYVLNHPRRCYTTLFPSYQTKWLLAVLIGITLIQTICFLALNYWLPVLEFMDTGTRFLAGFFQSVSTRSAGYSVVDVMNLNPATLIAYIVAMYISVYPVMITIRNSNVYQERALGIYKKSDDGLYDVEASCPPTVHRLKRSNTLSSVVTASRRALQGPDSLVMMQIQQQLTSEIFWLVLCIFCVCVIETREIMSISPISTLTIIYECVSAFGNIGASIGYPDTFTSQSARYSTLSKLVLIMLMYRGRHRGLPAAIDRAVLLPSEQLEQKEEDFFFSKMTSVGDGLPQEMQNRCGTI